MTNKILLIITLVVASLTLPAQSPEEKGLNAISESAVKGQLGFLASDWTEGRAVGTRGAYMAADYIASVFQMYGIEPFGDEVRTSPSRRERMAGNTPQVSRSYFQYFSLLEYAPGQEQSLTLMSENGISEKTISFNYKTDFDVRTGSVGQAASAPLVFAGYGIKEKDEQYNDFSKIDLNGKIAVIMEGFPGHKNPELESYRKFAPLGRYAEYYFESDKINRLKKMGAVAVVIVATDSDPALNWADNSIYPVKGDYYEADEPLSSYYDSKVIWPGDTLNNDIPVFTVTKRVANELFAGSDISLREFERQAAEEIKPASKELPGKIVQFKTTVDSKIIKARNVIGYIEGENKNEYIVVGGHYDHVGKYNGWTWNGADDNASGTVGVMTIAKAFMATGKKPEKSVIFAAWTGEEKGLWGSKYFVNQALEKNMDIVVKLNYDMIGRDEDNDTLKNKAMMAYSSQYPNIETITKRNIRDHNINLNLRYRPSSSASGGSDHAPFAQAGIPIFYFMAAMHPDYHQPSDELSKINWTKMTDIIRIGFLNTWEFANTDKFLEKKEPVSVNP